MDGFGVACSKLVARASSPVSNIFTVKSGSSDLERLPRTLNLLFNLEHCFTSRKHSQNCINIFPFTRYSVAGISLRCHLLFRDGGPQSVPAVFIDSR